MSRILRLATCGLAAAVLLLHAQPARCAWLPYGTPVTLDGWDETFPVLTCDGHGGAIIAWQEQGRIFAQRLTADGDVAPGWPAEHGLEACPIAGPDGDYYLQSSARVASDGAGGAFILWHDQRHSGCAYHCFDELKELYLQRIGPDGNIARGWPSDGLAVGSARWWMGFTAWIHSPRPSDFNTVMVPDGDGGVLIAWQEGPPFSGDSMMTVRAQRVSGDGALLWGARGALVCAAAGDHWYPAIADDGDGGAYVVWQDSRDGGGISRLYGQHLSSTGASLWSRDGVRISSGNSLVEDSQTISGGSRRGLIVAWQATDAGQPPAVLAQLVTPEGRPAWPGDVRVAPVPGAQTSPALVEDRGGAVWLAWIDGRIPGSAALYAQKLDRRGAVAGSWPRNGAPVCASPMAERSNPLLAPDGMGGVYVTWFDGRFHPRAIRLTRWGLPSASWTPGGAHLSESELGDYQLQLVPDERHGAIVVWTEGRPPRGEPSMVLAQHLAVDGAATGPPRRQGWALPIGADGAAAPHLALRGLVPNPAAHSLTVAFTLPNTSPARIEVFDLFGRRIAARDVGELGAGAHVVDLGSTGTLAPGVYLMRLTQGGRSLTVRGAIVR